MPPVLQPKILGEIPGHFPLWNPGKWWHVKNSSYYTWMNLLLLPALNGVSVTACMEHQRSSSLSFPLSASSLPCFPYNELAGERSPALSWYAIQTKTEGERGKLPFVYSHYTMLSQLCNNWRRPLGRNIPKICLCFTMLFTLWKQSI